MSGWLLLLGAVPSIGIADDAPFGMMRRQAWTTSRIIGSPEPPPPYAVERVYPQLTFKNPVVLTGAPGSDRFFVVELLGKVYSFPQQGGADQAELVVDLKEHIPNLHQVYGLAFHPDFAKNRICYVCYVLPADQEDGTRVSQFLMTGDPPRLDPKSERVLITWVSGGHNGGCLKFGPDGYLYITTGDGGPAFPPDPRKSGQDVSNLLAGVLRIDVNHSTKDEAYRIPSDNPFVDLKGARGEVWAYGMRNPWRMSFDETTGDLWVGDVGWELWEMVYRVERGGNYGWSLVEGRQPVHRERQRGPTPVLPPTIEHSHIEARSITGGFVYHGDRLPELKNAYIYGDYVTGKIWAAWHDGKQITKHEELTDSTIQIICFGVDNNRELIIFDYEGGMFRLIRQEAGKLNLDFPRQLSQTGLFASVKDDALAPGVMEYSINAEPWSDGAAAQRLVALPGESKLDVETRNNTQQGWIKGHWKYPSGSVLAKTFSLEMEAGNAASRRKIETQILHFDVDTWRGYSYRWNDDQTDALLVDSGGVEHVFTIAEAKAPQSKRTLTWRFPARSQCILCHTTRAGSILGFLPEQLNCDHRFEASGVTDNQLRTWDHIGLFVKPPDQSKKIMVSPDDESASLDDRARAYLHVNCGHCHRRGGGGTAAFDAQYHFPLNKMNLVSERPTQGTFSLHRAEVVAPGDPYRSVLYYRMSKLGRGRMPYYGSQVIDHQGLALMRRWIEQLQPIAGKTPTAHMESVVRLRAQQRQAIRQLTRVGEPDQGRQHIEQLLETTSGALMLLDALERENGSEGALPDDTKQTVIALGTAHAHLEIRDLFERFVPEEKRTRRLGESILAKDVLKVPGDAKKGRTLFFDSSALQCKNCHTIENKGVAVGPDLTKIVQKQTREQLLESILQPSKRIDPKFITYLVETAQGQVYTGLLSRRDEKKVVLKTAQNKDVRIPVAEIEFIAPQQKSLMPELLLRDLTAQQAADLLAFLESVQ